MHLWLYKDVCYEFQSATCVNCAKINNSMLCMPSHVSAGYFRCDVLFLQGNGFRHIVASA